MKNYSKIIVCIIFLSVLTGINTLNAQVNLDMASEFNISVESYNRVEVTDNWVCYQNYVGLIIIALDEEGNYGEETLIREDDIFDFAISDTYLVITRYDYDILAINTFVSIYDLSADGFPLVYDEANPNNYQVLVDIVGDYFITGSRVNPSGFLTKVYSLNTFELVVSYDGLRSYEAVAEDKIMVGNSAELITYEIYEVTATGELDLLYSFNQYYETAIIDNNSLALKDSDKIDFYTIVGGDSLIFNGSYTLPLSDPLAYGFYYQNGVIGYNRYIWGEYCYLDLVDISDLDNPVFLTSFDYLTMTDPDEIESVSSCLLVCNGSNLYPSLANKPLIHLQVEQNSNVSFVEMVQGFRSGTYWSNIREDKIFLQDNIYLQTTDISDPYNPVPIPNNYPIGRYRWFDTDDGVFCTRSYPNLEYIYIYKLGAEDNLDLQDSVSVQASNNVYSIYFDGTEFIYISGGVVTSISFNDAGCIQNWSIPGISQWSYCEYVNNYLYLMDYTNQIYIYHIEDNNPTLSGIKTVGSHDFISVDETRRFLSIYTNNTPSVIFDLTEDPVNLNVFLNMGILYKDSNLTCKNGYMMFVGQSSYEASNNPDDRYICIYRESEDCPIYVDSILLSYNYSSIKLVMNEESNQMMIVLFGNKGTVIYTGTITPNGDLDINPLPLNVENYPNPFNPETTISYDLVQRGEVQIDIFNLKGQKVKTLLKKVQDKGNHKVTWQGYNQDGEKVSSDLYFYKLTANGREKIGKMTLLK